MIEHAAYAIARATPTRLEGGEKQRVAIGRRCCAQPRLLLMDEPLASLDAARRSEILGRLIERVRDEFAFARLCQPFDRRGPGWPTTLW